jgi:hypothetical protein
MNERLQDQHDRERQHELAVHQVALEHVLELPVQDVEKEVIAEKRFNSFGPALGNFSIQYNLSCAGIALRKS